jgi:hypothetical protein
MTIPPTVIGGHFEPARRDAPGGRPASPLLFLGPPRRFSRRGREQAARSTRRPPAARARPGGRAAGPFTPQGRASNEPGAELVYTLADLAGLDAGTVAQRSPQQPEDGPGGRAVSPDGAY